MLSLLNRTHLSRIGIQYIKTTTTTNPSIVDNNNSFLSSCYPRLIENVSFPSHNNKITFQTYNNSIVGCSSNIVGDIQPDSRLGGIRTATKKAGGTSKNTSGTPGKRLGLKKFGGQLVKPGNIIIKQRGRKFWEGENVGIGRDHTLYALKHGIVTFSKVLRINGGTRKTVVHVVEKNKTLTNNNNINQISSSSSTSTSTKEETISAVEKKKMATMTTTPTTSSL
jgi:large subunit ribosomal protein L27